MELIRGIHNIRAQHQPCVLTIGAFDGLHLGHQAVLRHLCQRAAEAGLPSTVVTLEPLPREYFSPVKAPARLMSFREKIEGLKELGIDRVLVIRFNAVMQQMEAEEFITRVFVRALGAKHIVVGDDLRFGHDGKGDFDLLNGIGRRHGFTVEDTTTLLQGEQRVSSTRIRELLEQGDFIAAERLLGRPYRICGKVGYGKQLGREIGTPTANIQLHRLRAAMSGVYAVRVFGAEDGQVSTLGFPANRSGQQFEIGVANVGTRPTVNDLITAILEVHLLNFSGDLYGLRLCVEFHKRIRDEQKFPDMESLKQQIQDDIAQAADFFSTQHRKT